MREVIFVLDIGTSSTRLAILDFEANCLWFNNRKYQPTYIDEKKVEQDPEDWFSAFDELMLEAMMWTREKNHVLKVVTFTSQRSSVIPVNKNGEALRPALMWQDKRHQTICDRIDLAIPDLQYLTGAMINTVCSGPKMVWIKEHEPDVYKQAYKLFTPSEFINYRFTGKAKIDYTYATRSCLFDIRKLQWHEELLYSFGIDQNKLSEVIKPGDIVGTFKPEWIERWGIPKEVPLVSAGGDQQCSAIGLGVIHEGTYELTAGTGGYVITMSKELPIKYHGITVNCSAIPNYYNYETTMLTCSSAFDYFRRLFFPELDATEVSIRLQDQKIGFQNLIVLPFFQGSATPDWEASRKADILGLSFSTSAEDITFACLQAIACELADHVSLLEEVSGNIAQQIMISGGLTRNQQFTNMLVNLFSAKVVQPTDFEASIYGAWINTVTQLDIISDYNNALSKVHKIISLTSYEQDPQLIRTCTEMLFKYRENKQIRGLSVNI